MSNILQMYSLTSIVVCFTFGIIIGKYHQNIFFNNILMLPNKIFNKILLKKYVFQISNLEYGLTSSSEIFKLFENFRKQLGNMQFFLLCENIINDCWIETLEKLFKKLDKNTFSIMFSIILSRIKNDDQKILKHFYIFLNNKYLSDYRLSIEEFTTCVMKINTHTFIKLCKETNAFYNETFIILILQHYRDERILKFFEPYPKDGVFNSGYDEECIHYELTMLVVKAIQYLQYRSNSYDLLLQECLLYPNFPISDYLEKELIDDKFIIKTLPKFAIEHKCKIDRLVSFGTIQLRSDREFIQKVVGLNGHALQYADKSLLDNKEFLFTLGKESSEYIIQYCSDRLKKEKEFIMKLLLNIDNTSIYNVFKYLDKHIRIQTDILLYCMSKNKGIVGYLDSNERRVYLQNK
jgi:hypothetical protein